MNILYVAGTSNMGKCVFLYHRLGIFIYIALLQSFIMWQYGKYYYMLSCRYYCITTKQTELLNNAIKNLISPQLFICTYIYLQGAFFNWPPLYLTMSQSHTLTFFFSDFTFRPGTYKFRGFQLKKAPCM